MPERCRPGPGLCLHINIMFSYSKSRTSDSLTDKEISKMKYWHAEIKDLLMGNTAEEQLRPRTASDNPPSQSLDPGILHMIRGEPMNKKPNAKKPRTALVLLFQGSGSSSRYLVAG